MEDLASLNDVDKKTELIKKLNTYYNSDIHSELDLGLRSVTGDKGSLCGLAAMYQAASQTILTISEIKQMSFDDIKIKMGSILGMDESTAKSTKDVEFLTLFHEGI